MSAFRQRGIISICDLTEEEIFTILKRADQFKKKKPKNILQGNILASCFFEPSTRTRLSFESAMLRLGGNVIGFSDSENISAKKGESLKDSIRVIGEYADIIVIRHPKEGAARLALESTPIPVINAGDGANQHPTQTLIDLFTMQECQEKLHSLQIAIVGDLKYARTAHSLALVSALFNMRLFFVSPEHLSLPESILDELRRKGVKFSFHPTIEEVIPKIDILYMTRIQKERFEEGEYEKCKAHFILNAAMLKGTKKNLKVLHPLPRLQEIDTDVDQTPYAYYFEQVVNGLYVRQAILDLLLRSH